MSQTIIEKLLNGAEVEWKPIDEIFTLKNGYTPSKSVKEYWIGGTIPWFRMEDLRAGERILKDSAQKVHINGVKGKLFPKNSIIMATTATIGEHALITVEHLCNQQFTNFVIKKEYQERLNIKFAYYYFFVIDKKAKDNISISSFPSVQMDKLKKWMFPIPPLSVQKEIVRILDAFTTHAAELTAELNQRKKQYTYYRDKLLTFSEDEVEWKPLSEIANFRRGSFPQPYGLAKWYDGKHSMPFVQVADIGENFNLVLNTARKISRLAQPKSVFVPRGTVIVSLQGSIGRVAVTQYDCYVDRTIGIFENFKIPISKQYFTYQLEKIFSLKKERARGSTIKTITKEEFSKFKIPFPSLVRQDKIVNTLDQIRKLALSISEGLPREIELRNKQYEYYRDQLLNFPKPENDAIKHNSTNR